MRAALRSVLVVALLATGAAGVMGAAPAQATAPTPAPPAASPGLGIRLLDAPLAAEGDPRARVYIVDHLSPGTTIRRRIEVTNHTPTAANVSLYAAAATIDHGSFLGSAGHAQNDLTTWAGIAPATATVAAGATSIAMVTVAVPTDAAPGEQYAVIWAEVRTPTVAGSVTQVSRVGIRVYLSVGPGGAPAAGFSIDALTAGRTRDGQPMVVASVHNTGGRALDMSGALQLTAGPAGLSAGPFPAQLGTTLAIGDTELVTVLLDRQLPAGPWKARITLSSGILQRDAAATVTFPASGTAAAVATAAGPRHRSGHADRGLVLVGLLVLLLLLALVLAWLARRRRRPPPDPRPRLSDRMHPV